MIIKIKGTLDDTGPNYASIDVGGICYQVFCPASTMQQLPDQGENVILHISRHQREDDTVLYGFLEISEKELFKKLMNVQGVGGKVALGILSSLTGQQLQTAILSEDKKALTAADGVGPKLAARLITELKDKISDFGHGITITPQATAKTATSTDQNLASDAISALTNLGYQKSQVYMVVQKLINEEEITGLNNLIKKALSQL